MMDFEYTANIITKSSEDDKGKYLFVPISSTSVDRQNDKMSDAAIERMSKQLQSGALAMHDQHGMGSTGVRYHWKDMLGQWVGAERQGEILYAKSRLNEANPDALKLWSYIHEQHMPVGFSIAGKLKKGLTEKAYGKRKETFNIIDDIELLEVSPVGIPANQDAVCKDMEDAIIKAFGEDTMEEENKEKENAPDYEAQIATLTKDFEDFKKSVDEAEQTDYEERIKALEDANTDLKKQLEELAKPPERQSTVQKDVGKERRTLKFE